MKEKSNNRISLVRRMASGLLIIHAILIPLFFMATVWIVENSLQERFTHDIRSSSGLIAQMVSIELDEGEGREIKSIFEYALLDGRLVFAEILLNEEKIPGPARTTGNPADKFVEDFRFGEHGDQIYFVSLPLQKADTSQVGELRLGYDEKPTVAQIELVYQRVALLVGGYIVLLVLVHIFLFVTLTRANETIEQHENTILSRRNQLEHLSRQLLTTQESERGRVARELHDGIGQSLSAIKVRAEHALLSTKNCNQSPDHCGIEPVVGMIQQAIEEVRNMAMALRPSILDDLGLLAATSWLCREFHNTHPTMEILSSFELQEREIPDRLKTPMYRILQESLNNIDKHSHATVVHVTICAEGGKIQLEVKDNGKGIGEHILANEENGNRGFGLTSMQERCELSDGTLVVESVEAQGTVIRADWPVRQRPRPQ